MMIRHDTFLTKLGDRGDRGCSRLWIEDSAGRLSRNGFATGSGFEATPRAGLGLIIRPSLLSSTHVSSRRSAAILSYESALLTTFLRGTPEARVRMSCNSIVVMPALRLFAIAKRRSDESWRIIGKTLSRPDGNQSLVSRIPARFDVTPAFLSAELTEGNLVFATEVIAHAKPVRVSFSGAPALVAIASQFVLAAGYALTPEGDYAR